MQSLLGRSAARVPRDPGIVTFHDFGGGWNAFENDLNMDPRYSTRFRNVYRGDDGAVSIRYGTQLFADFGVAGLTSLVGGEYYNGYIIVVDDTGQIAASDARGNIVILFNNVIAAAQRGAPKPWGLTTFVCFAKFNGQLVLTNGVDKPLLIDSNLTCTYLRDPASGTNAAVPNAKLCCGHTRYMVLALGSTIYISNVDSIGTFFGAPNPNDAVNLDLGTRVRQGATTIRGIASYSDKLIVLFDECILPITLGTYTTGTPPSHEPEFDIPFDGVGTVAQHSCIADSDRLRFCDITGVTTLQHSRFVSRLDIGRDSVLVNPPLRNDLTQLDADLRDRHVFAVRNKLESQYMLFVPLDSLPGSRIRGYVFSDNPDIKVSAWSEFYDWRWRWGCSSAAGNVFFGRDAQVYLYGSRENPLYADYIGNEETYTDGTAHTDGTGWTPVVAIARSGVPIKFDWIRPWESFNKRASQKQSRYVGFDTQGTAPFTVRMYVDNFFIDRSDPGEPFTDGTLFTDGTGFIRLDPLTTPSNGMDFVGGDNLGYGGDPYGELYGGGRIAQDERLFGWTAKFKINKFRVSGYAVSPLKIVSLSLMYNMGSIRR